MEGPKEKRKLTAHIAIPGKQKSNYTETKRVTLKKSKVTKKKGSRRKKKKYKKKKEKDSNKEYRK